MTRRSTAAATINNPGVPIPVAAPAPAPTPAPISAPPTFAPPPFEPAVPENILLSSSTQREQEQDLQFPGLSIYRLGEQVWFQTGPHWAIGVVIEVPMAPNTNYKIHPLNSPLICEQTHSHNEIPAVQLRPWVAWSTPPVTNRNLDTEHRTDYENLPWQQESRSGSIEVDASILKSRDVDISYTLIEKLTDRNHYSGVYHGAERFWVGDAVRIKSSSNPGMSTGREILVVSSIQDTTPTTPLAVRCRETGVIITGDVFRLTNHPQTVPPPPGLPSAVLGDLSARGRFAATNQAAPYWTYTLIHRAHAFKLEDIKGRWYPGSSLFRIVHGLEKFTELAQTASISLQEWDETGSRMNEMGTGGAGSTLGWRRFEQRHQAFNKAIPSRFVFTPIPQAAPPDAAMQTLGIHPHHHPHHPHVAAAETAPANPLPETIDLTADENEGMEFLADHDSVDEEFMKRMGEDAQSFLADEGDVFYGGL